MKQPKEKGGRPRTISWGEFASLCLNYWAKIEDDSETTYIPTRLEDDEAGDGFSFYAELAGDVSGDSDWTFLESDNAVLEMDGWHVAAKSAYGSTAKVSFLRVITDIPAILKQLE